MSFLGGGPKFVLLAILDGWGIAAPSAGNAITQAKTPNISKFMASYPHTTLSASGKAVGLPRGEDGNTETGHLNLGAGRIVYQDLERINLAIADGTFFDNQIFANAFSHVKKNNSALHLMGLVGSGGVHSDIDHLFSLIHMASVNKIAKLFLHLFTDGRDSSPTSAKIYIEQVEEVLIKEKVGTIASIIGRYWAMDRDQRWDRTAKAYFALTQGKGAMVKTPYEAIKKSYDAGKTDEFIEPSLILTDSKTPVALIKDGDAVVFYNFRIDRPRQLTKAFVLDDFSKANSLFEYDPYQVEYKKTHIIKKAKPAEEAPFERGKKLKDLYFVTMTEYSKQITKEGGVPAFPPEMVKTPIGHVVSSQGLRQLRITESEKERFVTFYFNGLRDTPFTNEERIIIPSPKVATYDKKPEMSSEEICKNLIDKIKAQQYEFIVVNFPNADMVGHTGNLDATIKAVEQIDKVLGDVANMVLAYEGALVITADHGNAEEMLNLTTGGIDTEHSVNPVPFAVIANYLLGNSKILQSGILADVAPTILTLMNIQVPSSMTGRNLLEGNKIDQPLQF
ncbi:MAG: 2,3-bisphosphoglycerate-independent phosphoglycerate mutase [Candidatus Woesebacteria bacterium GW2011_GWA1_39_8]|uniref:2,3-bisphosphoglycerate-independent phosphoglycerate mutase n=1 Tax=Candidatus Woesebacteria bacterium GW2011_GWA1_39_8 TaxID=1618552 RepID=A0A0G0S4H7_9BACT|nr:MAG: 2,3-bisphosphoglycerate-independent phosphoglycerate mutase [Candidatus Woesebacteria bacterium GW2011_GWA1_39_8]